MKNYEMMTLAELMEELKASVTAYNDTDENDGITRAELSEAHKKVVDRYNELSLLTVYGECLKDEQPILALAKTYYCPSVSVKDNAHIEVINGKPIRLSTRSIKMSNKRLNLVKFIEWNEEANRQVVADDGWRSALNNARKTVENQWNAFFKAGKDTHSMSIGKTKKAIQAMFDALVFIETKADSGKNALIANGDVAKWALGFSNVRKDSKDEDGEITIKGTVMSRQQWAILQMDMLRMASLNKVFEIEYGEDEEVVETVEETEA